MLVTGYSTGAVVHVLSCKRVRMNQRVIFLLKAVAQEVTPSSYVLCILTLSEDRMYVGVYVDFLNILS